MGLLSGMSALGDTCANVLKRISTETDPKNRSQQVNSLVTLGMNPSCWTEVIIRQSPHQITQTLYTKLLKFLEQGQTGKQAGSGTGTGGTTNLVSKGLTAQVLSFATEYGALTESTSNQVVTVQGSLDGVPTALIRQNLVPYCPPQIPNAKGCVRQGWLAALRRVSYGVSFNATQNSQSVSGTASSSSSSTAQPVTFTATGKTIASVNGRILLFDKRDVTSACYQQMWEQAFTGKSVSTTSSKCRSVQGKPQAPSPALNKAAGSAQGSSKATQGSSQAPSPTLLKAAGAALLTAGNGLLPDPNNVIYLDWQTRAFNVLNSANGVDALTNEWWTCGAQLVELLETGSSTIECGAKPNGPFPDNALMKDLPNKVQPFLNALSEDLFEEEEFSEAVQDATNKPLLALEYNDNRPPSRIDTSTVRLIYDQGLGKHWSITANGGVGIYDSGPPSSIPGASRLSNVQAGLEADYKLSPPSILKNLGTPTLSGTYYFQYQASPAILNVTPGTPLPGITISGLPSTATEVFAKKGKISIGQLKVTVGSGTVRVPFAISYSNRTELITKPEWKAQIGISYDFDSLFASAGSGKATP
jgi:hypothetical protein